MANSTPPVADPPAAPILDALPDAASPDPTVVVDPPFGPTADFYRPSKPTPKKSNRQPIGYQHPTMANSTAPVADLPAAPILDALPDAASPDPTVVKWLHVEPETE
eukprot:scaffold103467_cov39-Attheya_sp.AAC.2